MIRWMPAMVAALALASCDYEVVEREIGYKGRARVNPWLAAERFTAGTGREVKSTISWTAPDWADAVWLMPAAVLGNESFVRRTGDWVADGGHLILLVEHADAETNDWSDGTTDPVIEPPLFRLLDEAGIVLSEPADAGPPVKATRIEFGGRIYQVDASSGWSVATRGSEPGVFANGELGDGRISVITDGRLFRNRWIADRDHALLLEDLTAAADADGAVGFLRGAGVSLWALLRDHLWPVLTGLVAVVLLWLWRSLPRFGPLDAAGAPPVLRGYEHHLEALGDFQWRTDRAASLLAPLREQIVELGQRACVGAGRRDEDFFQFLADRAGLPRERVFRALAEAAPPDPSILTRATADLQQLLQVLHNPARS